MTTKNLKIARPKISGFTLIEMMLVAVIIGMFAYLGIRYSQEKTTQLRMDRTALQMQQVLNGGLAYYVVEGKWPNNIGDLETSNFILPNLKNPWGNPYVVVANEATDPKLFVYTQIPGSVATGTAVSTAAIIAGKLPLSYTSATEGVPDVSPPPQDESCVVAGGGGGAPASCFVVGSVNIPGQNLNNVGAVNFANLYHNGACVPVPNCPINPKTGTAMDAEIVAVPVSVTGIAQDPNCTDPNDPNTCGSPKTYPISSFTAYAKDQADNTPNGCESNAPEVCLEDNSGATLTGRYWRVCLSVATAGGDVKPDKNAWGRLTGTILAITRCVSPEEKTGSNFTVFAP